MATQLTANRVRTVFRIQRRAGRALAAILVIVGVGLGLPAAGHAQGGGDDLLQGFDAPLPGQEQSVQPAQEDGGDDLLQGFDAPLPSSEPGTPSAPAPGEAGGDLLSGFDDVKVEPDTVDEGPSIWELDGFVRLDGAYNYAHEAPEPGRTDYRGLSRLRLALQLELSLQLGEDWRTFISGQAFRDFAYQIQGEEQYTPEVLETYQEEAVVKEAWVQGSPWSSLDIKIGRQIVVWGKSDNIRIVDVLNPIDLREPGGTDLEDLRIPLGMTRIDYYVGDWSLTGIAIHEIRFNKLPAPGSDFFPAGVTLPPEEIPNDANGNTEWAGSLSGIFSGWDLAFYWADVFDDDAYIARAEDGSQVQRHARLHVGGFAVNVVAGNWLIKMEGARLSGFRFLNIPEQAFVRGDGLLGFEYSGITDTTLGFEAAVRHLFDHTPILQQPPDAQLQSVNEYVLSYRGTYLREKLDLVAVVNAFGAKAEEGTLQRYQATYEVAAALDLTGGVTIFTPGAGENPILINARDNDRVFFEVKQSF